MKNKKTVHISNKQNVCSLGIKKIEFLKFTKQLTKAPSGYDLGVYGLQARHFMIIHSAM